MKSSIQLVIKLILINLIINLIVIISIAFNRYKNTTKENLSITKVLSDSINKNSQLMIDSMVFQQAPGRDVFLYNDNKKYWSDGVPKHRKWLTLNEWKGAHCINKDQKRRFNEWKTIEIQRFITDMCKSVAYEKIEYPDLPMSVVVAQSILESAYGKSKLSVKSNNLFGHKYIGSDPSEFVIAADDSPTDRFRIYKSYWFSLRGHTKLLMRKYRVRIKGEVNQKNWLRALCGGLTTAQSKKWVERGNSVYATSCMTPPCYVDKIKHIISKYDLGSRCKLELSKIKNKL